MKIRMLSFLFVTFLGIWPSCQSMQNQQIKSPIFQRIESIKNWAHLFNQNVLSKFKYGFLMGKIATPGLLALTNSLEQQNMPFLSLENTAIISLALILASQTALRAQPIKQKIGFFISCTQSLLSYPFLKNFIFPYLLPETS